MITDALETAYAIGLPKMSLSLEAELDDVDAIIDRLRDLLTDLQAFLRRQG